MLQPQHPGYISPRPCQHLSFVFSMILILTRVREIADVPLISIFTTANVMTIFKVLCVFLLLCLFRYRGYLEILNVRGKTVSWRLLESFRSLKKCGSPLLLISGKEEKSTPCFLMNIPLQMPSGRLPLLIRCRFKGKGAAL